MEYLKKMPEKHTDADKILPGARSVIICATNYYHERDKNADGKIARYAYGRDYHIVLGKRLKKLARFLEDGTVNNMSPILSKYYVDTGPISERTFAALAGIGFVGKNSNIITPEYGSWVLLSLILTTAVFDVYDDAQKGSCGDCRRCIEQCPTGAIREDRTIDATKCISYLTIENRGPIPEALRDKIGKWLFGCDICQEICPHNSRQKPCTLDDLKFPQIAGNSLCLEDILRIRTDEEFTRRFHGSPLMRAKRIGLLRNACVVAGNAEDKKYLPPLEEILREESSELIKEHARWAIKKIASTGSERGRLRRALPVGGGDASPYKSNMLDGL